MVGVFRRWFLNLLCSAHITISTLKILCGSGKILSLINSLKYYTAYNIQRRNLNYVYHGQLCQFVSILFSLYTVYWSIAVSLTNLPRIDPPVSSDTAPPRKVFAWLSPWHQRGTCSDIPSHSYGPLQAVVSYSPTHPVGLSCYCRTTTDNLAGLLLIRFFHLAVHRAAKENSFQNFIEIVY